MWLPYAVFAINNSASTLGGELTPFFIDRGQHPRMPLSLPDLRSAGETPPAYATRMKALEQEVQALLHAAQQERKGSLDPSRVDTVFQVGDEVMLRTTELLDAAEIRASSGHAGRALSALRRWQVQTPTPWHYPSASSAALR